MNKRNNNFYIPFFLFIGFNLQAFCQIKEGDFLNIIKFQTKTGLSLKDSIWNINRPIQLFTQPTFVSVTVKETDENVPLNLICAINEPIKNYDTLKLGTNPTINFSNLSGGDYTLTFINLVNNHRASIKFSIEVAFWEKWWFSPFVFFVISCLLGLIFYFFYLVRLRSQLQLQSVRHELEMDALRAQMNPHFIFNCLNTIDSYILLNKTEEASEFLNKFSKLIRRILESSRQEFIPIEQDIDALELYIKLEQERSNPKFLYKISIDESLQANEYFIPSMLIQPFVENAILHGLRHKRDAVGELFLNFKVLDNQLVITLIDNGIGREASQKINSFKQLNKQSVGLKLTEERIEKLNEMYEGKAFLEVTDIVQDADRGTIVKIGLPLISQSDLSGR